MGARQALIVALCALACGAAAPSAAARDPAGGGHRALQSKSRLIASGLVDPRVRSGRLPRSFVGFSLEYNFAPFFLGLPRTGPNRPLVGLLRAIARTRSGRPPIRIGGGSTDDTWWNPKGRPRPRGITYEIQPWWVRGVQAFQRESRSPLILGLNLAQNKPAIAVDWAREAMRAFGRRVVFEIGNEPDIYSTRAYGRDRSGRIVTARRKPYTFRRYLSELRRFVRVLRRMRPRPRLAGPSACCSERWQKGIGAIARQFRRQFTFVSYHAYASHNCPGETPLIRPTIRNMLSGPFVNRLGNIFRVMTRSANRHRMPLRVTETNSIACGGKAGVSDSFASALWGADWLFTLAASGVSGADFHASSNLYAPFTFRGRERAATAKPLYYGILLFARATRGRSRLVIAVRDFRLLMRSRANVQFWAAQDRRKTVRVVVMNKSARRSGLVRVRIRRARRAGRLTRLTAPSLSSRTGVRFAGQTVPEGSLDGKLVGAPRSKRVRRRGRGVYVFRMPRGSAAILSVPRVPRR